MFWFFFSLNYSFVYLFILHRLTLSVGVSIRAMNLISWANYLSCNQSINQLLYLLLI